MTPDEVFYVRSSKNNKDCGQDWESLGAGRSTPRCRDFPSSTAQRGPILLQAGTQPSFLSPAILFCRCTSRSDTLLRTDSAQAGCEGMSARQECPPATAGTIEESEFVFRREKEVGELRERFATRKSFVLHGPSGSGKTFLLQRVMPEFSNVLYCQEATSPQLVFQSLALALVASRDRFVRGWLRNPQAVKTKSAISLRGIVL